MKTGVDLPQPTSSTEGGVEARGDGRYGRTRFTRAAQFQELLFVREAAITIVAVAMFALFSVTADGFLTVANLLDIARASAFVAIVGVGMTYLFIAGELDLSVGSLYGFAAIMMAWLITSWGLDPWVAFPLILLLGGAVGAINGGITTFLGVPSFIVTLGMLSLLRGLTLVISGAFPIAYPDDLTSSFFSLAAGNVGPVPAQILWMAAALLIGAFVLKFTPFGYHVYATGGNVKASHAAGIKTRRVKLTCFVMTGVLCGLVAALNGGWLRTADPTTGTGFELNVIGAVIIGGVALFGGEGSIYGLFLGAAILGMLVNGLVLLGVSGNLSSVFTGAIIILAAIADVTLRRRGGLRELLSRMGS